jgi:hypothetical protein
MKENRKNKRTRTNKRPKAEAPTSASSSKDVVQLPEAVAELLCGNVIDLSGASNFYRKKANVATLLEGFVEPLPNSHFRLANGFDSFFLHNLHLFVRGTSGSVSDSMAEALFRLGRQWAKIDYGRLPIASIPSDEFLRGVWSGAEEWEAFVQRDACIGEVWQLALSEDGSVRNWSGGSDPNDFELRIDFGWDTRLPPSMMIRLKGAPVAILMKWWMTLNPNSNPEIHPEAKELRETTGTILDSIVAALKLKLRITRPDRGRPRADFGEQAAYLLDHEGVNIALIAKKLCQLPQGAGPSERRQCFDRIRKAAKNYYKVLGTDYKDLTAIRVRQRIIRVPAGINPVKSE